MPTKRKVTRLPTPAKQAWATAGDPVDGIDELLDLGADSIVIQGPTEVSDRPRPLQRADNGQWLGYGVPQAGISTERLWAAGQDLVVVYHSDRPVTAGLTQIDRVRADAAYRGWGARDVGRGEVRFERGDVVIEARFSPSTGNITKARRLRPDTKPEPSAAVGQLGTLLRWLGEEP